jgi:hypothetical protein
VGNKWTTAIVLWIHQRRSVDGRGAPRPGVTERGAGERDEEGYQAAVI